MYSLLLDLDIFFSIRRCFDPGYSIFDLKGSIYRIEKYRYKISSKGTKKVDTMKYRYSSPTTSICAVIFKQKVSDWWGLFAMSGFPPLFFTGSLSSHTNKIPIAKNYLNILLHQHVTRNPIRVAHFNLV